MIAAQARPQVAAAIVFLAGTLLVATQVPPWCSLMALGAVGWALLRAARRDRSAKWQKGARFAFGALTALVVIGVLARFRTFNGLEAGTALLTVMGALKLLESRARRDDAIVIGVSLFLLLAACLANQAMWRVPLYLLFLWIALIAIALVAYSSAAFTLRAAMRLAARALAMALPLAIACFLFFPRYAGQFWALQRGSAAVTGLSDKLEPGSIDKLVSEYDPAFRVHFEGEIPPPEFRYWRGPVFNSFDGFTWTRRSNYVATPMEFLGEPIRYRVTVEPSNQRWLFTLDTVEKNPRYNFFMAHDRQLTAFEPITSAMSYEAVSYLRTRALGPLSTLGRRYETRLPENRNPRTLALAQQIRARASSDLEYTRLVLEHFRTSGLVYEVTPEATGRESVDEVLFDTKTGFCAHFASAYAMLMRAGGVPARVVTGYLGGEWNPLGGYLIVRQSDAHAWTEVWLEGQGWTRIDPTAVVEPARLQRGLYELMPQFGSAATRFIYRSDALNRFSQFWDGLNVWWNDNVLEFNLRSQLDLLRGLGFSEPGWRQLAWIMTAGLVLWLLWISMSLRRTVARIRPDRVARAWIKATRKFARTGTARLPSEGPMDYAERVAAAHPLVAEAARDIAARYANLRYGPHAGANDIAALEQRVRQLKL